MTYCVGDIHGEDTAFRALIAQIRKDGRYCPKKTTFRLVTLGDYVNRGPGSREVLHDLMTLPRVMGPSWDIRNLLGNHDALFLALLCVSHGYTSQKIQFSLSRVVDYLCWDGVKATMESYGIYGLEKDFSRAIASDLEEEFGVEEAKRRLHERAKWVFEAVRIHVPMSHLLFLEGCDVVLQDNRNIFVHGGIPEGVAVGDLSLEDALWYRDKRGSDGPDVGRRIYQGHTIHGAPQIFKHRTALDTGCFRSGILTAAILNHGGDCVRFMAASTPSTALPPLVLGDELPEPLVMDWTRQVLQKRNNSGLLIVRDPQAPVVEQFLNAFPDMNLRVMEWEYYLLMGEQMDLSKDSSSIPEPMYVTMRARKAFRQFAKDMRHKILETAQTRGKVQSELNEVFGGELP